MSAFGIYRGMLTDVSRLGGTGRVKVTVPQLAITSAEAPVAYNCRADWDLSVGCTVIVAFENGDRSHPVVLGQVM